MPRGDNGTMMRCPACKRGTFHTIKHQHPWTIYTCRAEGCGNAIRVALR